MRIGFLFNVLALTNIEVALLTSQIIVVLLLFILGVLCFHLLRNYGTILKSVNNNVESPYGNETPLASNLRLGSREGAEYELQDLTRIDGNAIVVFSSEGCSACESIYGVIEQARLNTNTGRIIPVIVGSEDYVNQMSAQLRGAYYRYEGAPEELMAAGVKVFPSAFAVDASGHTIGVVARGNIEVERMIRNPITTAA